MFAKLLFIVAAGLVVFAVVARGSSGHSPRRAYVVRPHDTLWTIAVRFYGGDPRDGVWKLEQRNDIPDGIVVPGQRLVLP